MPPPAALPQREAAPAAAAARRDILPLRTQPRTPRPPPLPSPRLLGAPPAGRRKRRCHSLQGRGQSVKLRRGAVLRWIACKTACLRKGGGASPQQAAREELPNHPTTLLTAIVANPRRNRKNQSHGSHLWCPPPGYPAWPAPPTPPPAPSAPARPAALAAQPPPVRPPAKTAASGVEAKPPALLSLLPRLPLQHQWRLPLHHHCCHCCRHVPHPAVAALAAPPRQPGPVWTAPPPRWARRCRTARLAVAAQARTAAGPQL